jgi:hypothetical protein
MEAAVLNGGTKALLQIPATRQDQRTREPPFGGLQKGLQASAKIQGPLIQDKGALGKIEGVKCVRRVGVTGGHVTQNTKGIAVVFLELLGKGRTYGVTLNMTSQEEPN